MQILVGEMASAVEEPSSSPPRPSMMYDDIADAISRLGKNVTLEDLFNKKFKRHLNKLSLHEAVSVQSIVKCTVNHVIQVSEVCML